LAEAELELGHHKQLVRKLEVLVIEQPLRERLRALLMIALYRSGRQAEALAAYQDARGMLADELGLDPSEELQQLERAILNHDPSLALVGQPEEAGEIGAAVGFLLLPLVGVLVGGHDLVLAAVFLPILALLFGLAFPLGWLDPPDHEHLLVADEGVDSLVLKLGGALANVRLTVCGWRSTDVVVVRPPESLAVSCSCRYEGYA
jgi:hypothetical protein